VKITITWGYLVCPICIQKPYHVADHKSYHIQLHPILYPYIWLILYPPLWGTKSLDPYPQAATIALRSSAKVGNQTWGSSAGRTVSSFFWLSLFILTNPRGSDLISVPCKKHHFQLVSFISSPIFAAKSSPPFYTSSCLWKHPQSHHGLMGDETTTLGPSNGGCFIWGMGFGITVIEKTPRKGDWNRCRCPRSCWKKPSGEHGKLKNPTQLGFSIYQHHRTRLVGGWTLPLWKMMEFVSWEIDSQYMEK
jgi:hypothetical protein